MKLTTYILYFLLLFPAFIKAQITGPVIRAGFGVDADLRANYFNGFIQSGNDDWYNNGTDGTGIFVIDTTGAAALISGYTSNPATRSKSYFRTMKYPQYTVVNNRLLIDAIFIRDYHGDDSTVFAAGSNKNGMSPVNWSCPVSQGIPDKNDILDMLVHIRRAGANNTDSLWMFGGVSIENTTGNRYFDFEMYQSDIYYDRPSRKFYNYGADEGHTSWQLDGAGNIITPGDIIFTAEFGNSSLTNLEARIWVHQSTLSITPVAFSWGGQFDGAGAGAQYGYASILPKTAGAFYSGLQCGNGEWVGPFNLVRQDNSIATTYMARQFMEFSVNLTKLGLDPVNLLGGDVCGMPFRRILVKTRASTAFTAELKDFVGPFDLFIAPRVELDAEVPFYCGESFISTINVSNPHASSVYTWTTPDGHIIGEGTGTIINVDSPGTYIVRQALVDGCTAYATDSITLIRDEFCYILAVNIKSFSGIYKSEEKKVYLNWTVLNNENINSFSLEKSVNGIHFFQIDQKEANRESPGEAAYHTYDAVSIKEQGVVYYRIKLSENRGFVSYSRIIKILTTAQYRDQLKIMPNPVINTLNIGLTSNNTSLANIIIFNAAGKNMLTRKEQVIPGFNMLTVTEAKDWVAGLYYLVVGLNDKMIRKKIILVK
ncbi:MAG TPA: T9SS type A sorting domain-containing protein [Chitinophagaceae bacterium]|nr:T9SS type A sorting domain-containing protein [Chitinophagaceae bacterium]